LLGSSKAFCPAGHFLVYTVEDILAASEVCNAGAEEGLDHLNKQYTLQENFHTSYEHVVDEVSEALQATSAANRSAPPPHMCVLG